MPQHFVPGPTYPESMHEILMEYIARDVQGACGKPKIAYVYPTPSSAATAFPAARRAPQKLGLPIVEEIVTKQAGIDVTPEVAQAAPRQARHRDLPGLHRWRRCPEFVRQMREAGLTPQGHGHDLGPGQARL